jgi:hypothetical protein
VTSTVPVEIVQPGVKDEKKDQNTCDPNNSNIAPLSDPPYSDDQYESVANLYLRAAYIAGTFPEITTHFVVDSFIGGHCDPRCFKLHHLYDLIAAKLGHAAGSTYGVVPTYGLKSGTSTIWWDDGSAGARSVNGTTRPTDICHGKPYDAEKSTPPDGGVPQPAPKTK